MEPFCSAADNPWASSELAKSDAMENTVAFIVDLHHFPARAVRLLDIGLGFRRALGLLILGIPVDAPAAHSQRQDAQEGNLREVVPTSKHEPAGGPPLIAASQSRW